MHWTPKQFANSLRSSSRQDRQALGIAVLPSIHLRADEVIE